MTRRLLGPGWVTLGVAGALVAAVLGAGLLVQKVALPSPAPATLAAVRAATWLQRYRLVESTFSIGGGPAVHGQCFQDWFRVGGRRNRGAALQLDDGFVLLAVQPHTLASSGGSAADRSLSPLVLMELGGCPRVLARRLDTLAQEHRGVTLANGELRFTLKATRIVMTLESGTGKPLGMKIVARGTSGTSRIRFAPVTTSVRRLLSRSLPVDGS
ncbi:MAG: hypothetical protein ACJ768_12530 [Gaiellaceae bacterium]